jgi:hypothetical protein
MDQKVGDPRPQQCLFEGVGRERENREKEIDRIRWFLFEPENTFLNVLK